MNVCIGKAMQEQVVCGIGFLTSWLIGLLVTKKSRICWVPGDPRLISGSNGSASPFSASETSLGMEEGASKLK